MAHHSAIFRTVIGTMVVAGLILLGACDQMVNSPFPEVAGTYTGTTIMDGTLIDPIEIGTMRIKVVQSGSQVTISTSMTFFDETIELPDITGEINETGFFTATGGGFSGDSSFSDPHCGRLTPRGATLSFSDGTARWVEYYRTDNCREILFSTNLSR